MKVVQYNCFYTLDAGTKIVNLPLLEEGVQKEYFEGRGCVIMVVSSPALQNNTRFPPLHTAPANSHLYICTA